MPEISRFFGVVITMYYNDHNPPHFHARYGEQKAVIGIEPLRLLEGSLPPRAIGFVMEWAALHGRELLDDWQLARTEAPLRRIAPLE